MDKIYEEKRKAIKEYVHRNQSQKDTTDFYKDQFEKLKKEQKYYLILLEKLENYTKEMKDKENSLENNVVYDMVITLKKDVEDTLSRV